MLRDRLIETSRNCSDIRPPCKPFPRESTKRYCFFEGESCQVEIIFLICSFFFRRGRDSWEYRLSNIWNRFSKNINISWSDSSIWKWKKILRIKMEKWRNLFHENFAKEITGAIYGKQSLLNWKWIINGVHFKS